VIRQTHLAWEEETMTVSSPFGKLLSELREQAGLSKEQLATRLHVDRSFLAEVEGGKSKLPREPKFYNLLWNVSEFSDTDITWLQDASGYKGSAEDIPPAVYIKDVAGQPQNGILIKVNAAEYTLYLRSDLEPAVAEAIRAEATQTIRDQAPNLYFIPRYWFNSPKAPSEEAQEHSSKSLPGISDSGIISVLMAPEKVENGDHLTEHISELQSQAKLGSETKQRPTHYPHENVVFHVGQLQAEDLRQQGKKKGSKKSYEVVATLGDAAERTGVADDEILTTSDIEAEYHINKKLVHEYTKRGRQGQPHLTPLDVRLARGGGSSQLLFRRVDIERIVANPPKSGRPRKPEDVVVQEKHSPQPYELVATLSQAAEKTGVPLEEIMTTRDIQAEWNVSRLRVLRWTWSGPHGQPHLMPLLVRLKGGKAGQLLFRRSDVEGIVTEPPKGGRPSK
jgi:transcriptional regulator with XRE-family HTH domain